MFGQILLAVVAVAVTVLTAGATAGLGPILSGAVAGATGSVASQAVGVATGIQEKFSWKQVGLAAIGGGVGGAFKVGFGQATKVTNLKTFGTAALRGAAQSAVTQGIGVATGLQDKFSWSGVAAAGVGAGIGGAFDARFGGSISDAFDGGRTGAFAANIAQSSASAIANAATRSAISGTNFGDNIIAAIPDVVGQALGSAIAGGIGESVNSPIRKAFRLAEAAGYNPVVKGGRIHTDFTYFDEDGVQQTGSTTILGETIQRLLADDVSIKDIQTSLGDEDFRGSYNGFAHADFTARWQVILGEPVFTDEQQTSRDVLDRRLRNLEEQDNAFFRAGKRVLSATTTGAEKLGAFAEKRSTLARIGLTLAETSLGGPVKGIVKRIGKTVLGDEVGKVEDRAGQLISDKLQKHLGLNETFADILGATGVFALGVIATASSKQSIDRAVDIKYKVGDYRDLKRVSGNTGLDAHHAGQKAGMKKFINGYDEKSAPSILVPRSGHTFVDPVRGRVSTSLKDIKDARHLLGRDIRELRRVYPDIPNSQLQELIRLNKLKYPKAFKK